MKLRHVDMNAMVESTEGASGAQIKAICTEAGMFAVRERRAHVTQKDFDAAIRKVFQSSMSNASNHSSIFR